MTKGEKETVAAFCSAFQELAARMRLRSTVRMTGEDFLDDAEDACAEVAELFTKKEVQEFGVNSVDTGRVYHRA